MDLAQILTGINSYVNSVGVDKANTADLLTQNAELRQKSIEAMGTAAQLEQEANAHDIQQALTMEKRKKAVADAFGVDMLDPNNRVAMLAREQAATMDEYLAQTSRAAELMQMNIFDDPLQYMVQRPFVARNIQAAAAAKDKAAVIDKAIMDLNQQSQASVQTQAAINENLNADEAEKRAQILKIKAEDAIRAAQIGKNDALVKDIKTLQGMTEEQLRWAAEAWKLKRHDEEFRMRMEEARAAREARAKEKKSTEDQYQYQLMRYNLGAEMLGRSKAQNVEDLKSIFKFGNKKQIAEIIELGETVWIDPTDPTGTTRLMQLDRTPGRSKLILDELGGKLPASAAPVSALLDQQRDLAVQTLQREGVTKITPDALAAQINKQLLGSVDKEGKNKKVTEGLLKTMMTNREQSVGKLDNIYKAPSAEVIGNAVPALSASPLWLNIINSSQYAESTKSPSVDAMLKQGALSIREGKAKPEEVADFISTYFSTANRINSSTNQYQLVGLPVPTAYNTQVTTYDKWTGKKTVGIDATNKQQILHVLANQAVPSGGTTLGRGTIFGFN